MCYVDIFHLRFLVNIVFSSTDTIYTLKHLANEKSDRSFTVNINCFMFVLHIFCAIIKQNVYFFPSHPPSLLFSLSQALPPALCRFWEAVTPRFQVAPAVASHP